MVKATGVIIAIVALVAIALFFGISQLAVTNDNVYSISWNGYNWECVSNLAPICNGGDSDFTDGSIGCSWSSGQRSQSAAVKIEEGKLNMRVVTSQDGGIGISCETVDFDDTNIDTVLAPLSAVLRTSTDTRSPSSASAVRLGLGRTITETQGSGSASDVWATKSPIQGKWVVTDGGTSNSLEFEQLRFTVGANAGRGTASSEMTLQEIILECNDVTVCDSNGGNGNEEDEFPILPIAIGAGALVVVGLLLVFRKVIFGG